ncbi:hypothetical protein [Halocatena halophila]|uniref:hypothetical protein n=1 Tax=Halocatena halophila TaxID=2814576 RepID=UPI002ED620A4
MTDDRPTDEIEPLVPIVARPNVRPDGGVLRRSQSGPEVLPENERYSIEPLVPDLS